MPEQRFFALIFLSFKVESMMKHEKKLWSKISYVFDQVEVGIGLLTSTKHHAFQELNKEIFGGENLHPSCLSLLTRFEPPCQDVEEDLLHYIDFRRGLQMSYCHYTKQLTHNTCFV